MWSFTRGCRLWLTSPPKHVDLAKWYTRKLWRWALHTLMPFSWRLMATLITILGWVSVQNCSGSCFCILKLCLSSLSFHVEELSMWFPGLEGDRWFVSMPNDLTHKKYGYMVWPHQYLLSNLHYQFMCSYDTTIVVTNPWSVDILLGTNLSTWNVRSLIDRS